MSLYDSGVLFDGAVYYDGFVPPQLTKNRMAKVKLGLQGLTPDQKVAYATTVKTAMTGNPNFLTPNPTLASVGTLTTALQTKINAYNAAVAAVAAALLDRDNAELALTGALTSLASYVDNTSGGDAFKIASAAMSVRAVAAAVGPLGQVLSFVVTANENEGALDLAWDPVRGALSYEVWISVDPITSDSWTHKMTAGRSNATITGLTTGAKQWVRVRAVGAKNQTGPWSDPAVKTVP
jgi:hypothetical protein